MLFIERKYRLTGMTNDEYAVGIATIISDYRKNELKRKLDADHVKRWVSQFDESEQSVVLCETFRILSRWYFKIERIYTFIEQVLNLLSEIDTLSAFTFVNVQTKGESQRFLYEIIKKIYDKKYNITFNLKNADFGEEPGLFVYVDDGLYTGRRAKEDLKPLLEMLPKGSTLYVYYMLAYSNNYNYWKDEICKFGEKLNIAVFFKCAKLFYNERNCKNDHIDFIWPSKTCRNNPSVKAYENKLLQTGKANYLYYNDINGKNKGLFSSYENQNKVSEIFLKYGIQIINQLHSSTFLPLGISNTPSFGFGSFCATDFNISNTCPLVLWWGSMEPNSEPPIGCWYPLLPRRGNNILYKEIISYEEKFSIFNYRDVLKTVYRLAEERRNDYSGNQGKFYNHRLKMDSSNTVIDINEIVEKRYNSNLYQYLKGLDMDTIKVIQTVMYLGRDYQVQTLTEDEWNSVLERCAEDPEFEITEPRLEVEHPEELFISWINYITFSKQWGDKDIEIEQITQKMPLDQYMLRAFRILGIQ